MIRLTRPRITQDAPSFAQPAIPEAQKEPVNPEPLRVLVEEVPVPGQQPELPEICLEDMRSLSAARKSRRGGYLRLPVDALRAIGKSAILLDKFVRGTDLILRIRLLPTPAHARGW